MLIPASDPKERDSRALLWAAGHAHAECVRLLIPVSAPKANNSAALRRADQYGHADCVAPPIIFSYPLALDANGLNAIDLARAEGHFHIAGMIDAFIEANALSNSLPPCQAMPAARASL